jgi:aryl-alcohol dehydrogenase-like predicted oxidoreductase
VVEELQRLAAEKGITPAQLAIAWVLAKGQRIVPVIGARTRKQLSESLAAVRVKLPRRIWRASRSAYRRRLLRERGMTSARCGCWTASG